MCESVLLKAKDKLINLTMEIKILFLSLSAVRYTNIIRLLTIIKFVREKYRYFEIIGVLIEL